MSGDTKPSPQVCASRQLEQRLANLADAGPPAIDARIAELDREWTAGRATKATIGLLIVVGFALTPFLGFWLLVLPAVGGLLLLQYMFMRTSWAGIVFHQLGFRTGFEVEQEKMALKVLRGDFREVSTVLEIDNPQDIARLEGEGGIPVEPEAAKVDPIEAARKAVEAIEKA
jgi:hypothetical protein